MSNLSPTVQLAQDRLREFRQQFSASWTEIAQVVGLDVKKLKLLSKQKAGPNVYASVVMNALGSESYYATGVKMRALRSNGASTRPEASKGEGMTIQDIALNMFDEFKNRYGYSEQAASLVLGYRGSSVAGLRHSKKNGRMGEQSAQNLIDKVKQYSPTRDQSPVRAMAESNQKPQSRMSVKKRRTPDPDSAGAATFPAKPLALEAEPLSCEEGIQITERLTFCLGSAVNHIAAGDLERALWYLNREIARAAKTVEGESLGRAVGA